MTFWTVEIQVNLKLRCSAHNANKYYGKSKLEFPKSLERKKVANKIVYQSTIRNCCRAKCEPKFENVCSFLCNIFAWGSIADCSMLEASTVKIDQIKVELA